MTPGLEADTAAPVITEVTLWRDAVAGDIAGETGNTRLMPGQLSGLVDVLVQAHDEVPAALAVTGDVGHEQLMVARAGYQVLNAAGAVVVDSWTVPTVDFMSAVASGANARTLLLQVGPAGAPEFWVTNPTRDGQFPKDEAWDTTQVADGAYTLRVLVRDAGGREATRDVPVVVANQFPRVVKVTATPAEADPGQTVTVKIQFSEPVLPQSVRVTAGRTAPFSELTITPAAVAMSTTTLPGDTWTGTVTLPSGAAAGVYQVSIEASDLSGNRLDGDRNDANGYQAGPDSLDKFVVRGTLIQTNFSGATALDKVSVVRAGEDVELASACATWAVCYDGSALPETVGWTKNVRYDFQSPARYELLPGGFFRISGVNDSIQYERSQEPVLSSPNLTVEFRCDPRYPGDKFDNGSPDATVETFLNQMFQEIAVQPASSTPTDSAWVRWAIEPDNIVSTNVPLGFHVYRLVRSPVGASMYIDGKFIATVPPSNPSRFVAPGTRVLFHSGSTNGYEVTWDYVAYTEGSFSPDQLGSPTGFSRAGAMESAVLDAGQAAEWRTMRWAADAPAGTSVRLQVRTSEQVTMTGPWSAALTDAGGSTVSVPPGRYLQYRALFASDGNVTPVLHQVEAVFAPFVGTRSARSANPHVVVESTATAITFTAVSPLPAEAQAALTAQNLAVRSADVQQIGPVGSSFVVEPATVTYAYPFPPPGPAEARYRLMQFAGNAWRDTQDQQVDLLAHQARGRVTALDAPSLFAVVEPLDPETPTGLTGTAQSPTAIRWTWADRSAVETGYRVLDGAGASVSGDLAANTVTFDEAGLPVNTAVTRRVEAFSTSGAGRSGLATRFTLAAPPANLRVLEAQESRVTVAWEANGNPAGTGYVLERATATDAPFVTLVDSRAVTAFRDDGLVPLTTAYYRVRAVNGDGIPTVFSALVTTRTAGFVPLEVEAAPAVTSVHLSWHDLSVSSRGVGQGWVVDRASDVLGSPGPFTRIVSLDFLAVPRYTDRGLPPGTTVWYRVQKANFSVIGEPSHPVRAQTAPDTTPPAVTLAEFTTPWLSPNGDGLFEATTISFHLTEQATYQMTVKSSTGAVVRTLVNRGFLDEFSDGEDEGWRVISGIWNVEDGAYHGNARGAAVAGDEVAVAEVDSWGNLVYEGRVRLDAGDPGVYPEGGLAFRVEATTNPVIRAYYYFRIHSVFGGGAALLKLVNGHEAPLTTIFTRSQPIERGRSYQLRVEAVGGRLRGFVDGVLVHEVEDAAPLPAGRVGVRVSGGDESPSLAVFDDIQVLTNGDTLTWDGRAGGGAPVPDGVYTIQLDATDPAGLRAVRTLGTVRVDATPPTAVAQLTARASASVRLFWTPAEDAGLGVARYLVERGTASAGPFVMIGSSTAADFTDAGPALVHGQTFFYRVRGVDFGENTQPSGPVASVTIDTVPPAQITDLLARPGTGRGAFTLTWTAPGDDGTVGRLVGRYLIAFGTASGSPSSNVAVAVDTTPGSSQTFGMTGFSDGTTVYATVRAEDDAGLRGLVSAEVSTRTFQAASSTDAVVNVLYERMIQNGQDVTVTLTPVSTVTATSALAISTGSGLQLFSPIYDIGPDSSTFVPPARVTFFYTDPVPPPQETELNVYRFNATTGKWNPLPKLSQDTTANFLVVSLSSTSLYAVFGPADYDPPVSALAFEGPAVVQPDGTIVVSERTRIVLTAQDPPPREFGLASGVAQIQFTLNGSGGVVDAPFAVVGPDGTYRLTWAASDRAGNVEPVREATLVLDATLPTARLLSPAPEDTGVCRVITAAPHRVMGMVDDAHLAAWRLEVATGAAPGMVEPFTPVAAGSGAATSAALAVWDATGRRGWQTVRLLVEDRVQHVSTTAAAVFVGEPALVQTLGPGVAELGGEDAAPTRLHHPEAVAIGPDGTRWVADTGGDRVLAFMSGGALRLVLGALDEDVTVASGVVVSRLRFKEPQGVAAFPDGGVLVADTGQHRLVVVSSTGGVRQVLGRVTKSGQPQPGTSPGEFNQPRGVDVDASGNTYVADTENHRWQVLSASGTPLMSVTLPRVPEADGGDREDGGEAGELEAAKPVGIARDRTGNRVYVSEAESGQVFIYAVDLSVIPATATLTGTLGGGPGTFRAPRHLAATAQGHLYVAERNANRVRKFDRFGAEVLAFGVEPGGKGGEDAAPTRMNKPTGVGVGSHGELAVAVRQDDQVKVFDAPSIVPVVASAPPVPRAAAARPDRSLAYLGPPHDFALGPNPARAGAPVNVYFVTGWSNFETDVRVYTATGKPVDLSGGEDAAPTRAVPVRWGAPGYTPGRYARALASRNESGEPLASGMYLVQIKVHNPDTDEIVPMLKKVLIIR